MSYTAKNYTEQGGDKTVIGGELEILEGAKVTGLVSAVVLDFNGMDIISSLTAPLDVTDAISKERFLEATSGKAPVLITNCRFGNMLLSCQSVSARKDAALTATGVLLGMDARITDLVSALIYLSGDRVCIRTNSMLGYNVSVTGVTLNESSVEIATGSTLDLTATVIPASASEPDVNWSVSDGDVLAFLWSSGSSIRYRAQTAGTATVTVTTLDGGYTATCNVTVTDSVAEGTE